MEQKPKFWIVTGLSGAGKTNAIRILEDWGYFCVDNLPPALMPSVASMVLNDGTIQNVAIGIDIRSRRFFDTIDQTLSEVKESGYDVHTLFIDADTPTLVKRFKETRRKHPMASEGDLIQDIARERDKLGILKATADIVIDTSTTTTKEFKEVMKARFMQDDNREKDSFNIYVVSFGYKYGIPLDSDLVMDVRFLPNPYYIPELKEHTGLEKPVFDYVMEKDVTKEFFHKYLEMIKFLIPNYIEEGKTGLVIAVGCTGGQHRSVALAQSLGEALKKEGFNVAISHRDVDRKNGR